MKPRPASWLALLHAAGVAALAVLGVWAWRLRCEGFGCMGVGLVWMGWAGLFLVWLVFGLVAAHLVRTQSGPRRIARLSVAVQLLAGLVPLGYWATHQLARHAA